MVRVADFSQISQWRCVLLLAIASNFLGVWHADRAVADESQKTFVYFQKEPALQVLRFETHVFIIKIPLSEALEKILSDSKPPSLLSALKLERLRSWMIEGRKEVDLGRVKLDNIGYGWLWRVFREGKAHIQEKHHMRTVIKMELKTIGNKDVGYEVFTDDLGTILARRMAWIS